MNIIRPYGWIVFPTTMLLLPADTLCHINNSLYTSFAISLYYLLGCNHIVTTQDQFDVWGLWMCDGAIETVGNEQDSFEFKMNWWRVGNTYTLITYHTGYFPISPHAVLPSKLLYAQCNSMLHGISVVCEPAHHLLPDYWRHVGLYLRFIFLTCSSLMSYFGVWYMWPCQHWSTLDQVCMSHTIACTRVMFMSSITGWCRK